MTYISTGNETVKGYYAALIKEAKEEPRERQKIKHSVTMIEKIY